MLVVSAYVKETDGNPGYISGTIQDPIYYDFGSILKFIEGTFALPAIAPGAGYADENADDLSDCFDFTQTARTFQMVPAKYDAAHFLNDKSPPVGPDDD